MPRLPFSLLVLLFALLGLLGCSAGDRERPKKLTLYCSTHIDWCLLVKDHFERETGIRVRMSRKSTGEQYAQIWAERRNPKGDIWWGGTGDGHIQAAAAGLTDAYESPRLPELHPWARDPMGDGKYLTTGVYMGALGFAYNKPWLEKKGLSPPMSWRDLLAPEFEGEIQMANPNSSGTAYTILATLVQMYGEEEAFEFMKKLHRNINQYTKSGAAPARAAGRGETGIGIAFAHDIMTQIRAGFPVELIIPPEGTGFEVGCASIIRGARHPESARRFLDWVLGPAPQALGAQAKAFQTPSNVSAPIAEGIVDLSDVEFVPIDFQHFGNKDVRTRLLKRWEKEVQSASVPKDD